MEDQVLRALKVKGRGTTEALAAAAGGDVTPTLQAMTAAGLIEETRLGHRLTDAGSARALQIFERDLDLLAEDAVPLYEAFTEVNDAVKQVVTDWQLRIVGDEQVLNDHTDTVYDDAVIARLTDAHHTIAPTLSALAGHVSAYARYHARLDAALAAVHSGDPTLVASPAKDSYHTVWFELHQDLILCTGRTRADESLAGRA